MTISRLRPVSAIVMSGLYPFMFLGSVTKDQKKYNKQKLPKELLDLRGATPGMGGGGGGLGGGVRCDGRERLGCFVDD
jgi:hypothetical protein